MVIPAMDHLDEYLTMASLEYNLPLSIKATLTVRKKTLNCYYNKTDYSEVFQIAMSMYHSIV
jgi:hypothetical protein